MSYPLPAMAAGELYAFGWIGSVLLSTAIASSKNRSGCGWLAMGVSAGPLYLIVHPLAGVGVIVALVGAAVLLPARPPPAVPASTEANSDASDASDAPGAPDPEDPPDT